MELNVLKLLFNNNAQSRYSGDRSAHNIIVYYNIAAFVVSEWIIIIIILQKYWLCVHNDCITMFRKPRWIINLIDWH